MRLKKSFTAHMSIILSLAMVFTTPMQAVPVMAAPIVENDILEQEPDIIMDDIETGKDDGVLYEDTKDGINKEEELLGAEDVLETASAGGDEIGTADDSADLLDSSDDDLLIGNEGDVSHNPVNFYWDNSGTFVLLKTVETNVGSVIPQEQIPDDTNSKLSKEGFVFEGWSEKTEGVSENDLFDTKNTRIYQSYDLYPVYSKKVTASFYTDHYVATYGDLVSDNDNRIEITPASTHGDYVTMFSSSDEDVAVALLDYGVLAVSANDSFDTEITASVNSVWGSILGEAKYSLKVNKKDLTVSAGNAVKVYDGTPLSENSYTPDGLVKVDLEGYEIYEDVIDDITVTGSLTDVGVSVNSAKVTKIVRKDVNGTDVTANYNISYKEGKLEVTPRDLTLEWSGEDSYKFDYKVHKPAVSAGNIVDGDTVSVNVKVYKAEDTDKLYEVTDPTDVGSYVAVATLDKDKFDNKNYALSSNTTFEYEITEDAIEYEVISYNGVYDQKNHGITVSVNHPETGYKILYKTGEEEDYRTEKLEFKNVGDYTVYYMVTAPNFKPVSGNSTVTITKADMPVSANDVSVSFDGVPHSISIDGIPEGEGAVVKYGTEEGVYDKSSYSQTVVGSWTVYFKVTAPNYNDYTGSAKLTITGVPAKVITPPTSVNGIISYNKAEQKLFIEGTTDTKLWYSLDYNGDKDKATWYEFPPKGKDAGTYNLYYFADSDTNHSASTVSGPVVKEIEKAVPAVTAPVSANNLSYNKADQVLVTAGTTDEECTLMYAAVKWDGTEPEVLSKNDARWSDKLPKGKDAGTYRVFWYVKGNDNYKDVDPSAANKVDTVIKKADPVFTTYPLSRNGLIYNGLSQNLITAGVADGGTVKYKKGSDGNYSEAVPTAIYANDNPYIVYYKIFGDDNYNDSAEESLNIWIGRKPITISVNKAKYVYGDSIDATEGNFTISINGFVESDGPLVCTYDSGNRYYYKNNTASSKEDANQYKPYRLANLQLGNSNTRFYVLVSTNSFLKYPEEKLNVKEYDNFLNATMGNIIDGENKLKNYILPPKDTFWAYGDVEIIKADIVSENITKKPTAIDGIEYDGISHKIVSAGSVSSNYGNLYYSADYSPKTEYKPEVPGTWTQDVPEKTEAGEYNVYYKVVNTNGNYNDSPIFGPVVAKISTASSNIIVNPVAKSDLYFDNTEQELLGTLATAENGTIYYALDPKVSEAAPAKDSPLWSTTAPKAKNAGQYRIWYYCKGNKNYADCPKLGDKDYPCRYVDAYIRKAQLKITANDATVVYGDSWDDAFSASIEAVFGVYNPDDFELLGIKYDKATGNAVGTYKVMPRMVCNPVNYEVYHVDYDDVGYVYGTLTITPAPLTVKADDQYKNYGDTDPELTYTVTGLKYNDTKDVLTNVSIKRAKGEDAGTYPITISGDKIAGNENYNPVTYEDGTFVIGQSDVLVTVLPEAKDLTYDGTEQELVKAGNAFGVDNEPLDFMYSEDYAYDPTTNTVTNSGNWVKEIPTKKNVGTYPVWWKVVSGNYIETDPAPLSVTIKARPFSLDPEVAVSQNLVYDRTVQNLVNESVIKNLVSENDLKIEYRVGGDGCTWTTDIPSAKDAGEYDIYYRVNVDDNNKVVDENYEVVEITGPLKGKIAPRSFTIEPAVSANTYIYDRAEHDLTNTSTVGNIIAGDTVELMYRVGLTGEWSKDVPKATNVDKYPIYYKVNVDADNQTLDTNYEVQEITGPLNAEIYINQSEFDTAPEAKLGLVYKAESHELVSKGTAKNGTVMYADLDHALAEGETINEWSVEVPKATNAGTHYIYYMVKGDDGYADVAQAGPLTVTIAKAAAPTINNAEATLLRSEGTDNLYKRITFAEKTEEAWYSSPQYSLTGSDSVARLENNIVRAKSQTGIVTAKIVIPENANTLGASAEIKITVKGQNEGGGSGDEPVEDGELKAWLADVDTLPWSDTEYYALTYTGEPIKPEVIVTNGTKVLVPGTDYSVAYQNNKEANVTYNSDNDLVAIDKKKLAKVTITGKGNYSTKKEIEFLIVAKNIADDDVYVGNTVCEYNKKPAPVITYMGKVVNKKNYTGVPAINLTEDGVVATIYGTGNFYGERSVDFTVKVKSELKEFKVRLANVDNIYYNGDAKTLDPESQLIVSDKSTGLQIDPENYIVSYGDNVNAGTVNVYVIGTGLYKSSVKKTFKIRPAKYATFTITNATELATTGYPYSRLGVTPEPYLSAKIDEEHDEVSLVLGRDYTVTYKDNKKVGSGMVDIKFKGNYQGAPKLSQSFKITRAEMTGDNCKVILAKSLVFNPDKPKASNYFVKKNKNLFVELNGVMLKSGDYEVSFWRGEENLTKDTPISAGNTITVKITANPKSDKYVTAIGADIEAEYVVTSGGTDISKAKVSVVNSAGRKKSVGYTGKAITFPIEYAENIPAADRRYLQVVVNGVKYIEDPESNQTQVSDNFEVSYVNNVRKGTATVIITPKEGTDFSGSAVGTFKIDSSIFKTFLESLLDERN